MRFLLGAIVLEGWLQFITCNLPPIHQFLKTYNEDDTLLQEYIRQGEFEIPYEKAVTLKQEMTEEHHKTFLNIQCEKAEFCTILYKGGDLNVDEPFLSVFAQLEPNVSRTEMKSVQGERLAEAKRSINELIADILLKKLKKLKEEKGTQGKAKNVTKKTATLSSGGAEGQQSRPVEKSRNLVAAPPIQVATTAKKTTPQKSTPVVSKPVAYFYFSNTYPKSNKYMSEASQYVKSNQLGSFLASLTSDKPQNSNRRSTVSQNTPCDITIVVRMLMEYRNLLENEPESKKPVVASSATNSKKTQQSSNNDVLNPEQLKDFHGFFLQFFIFPSVLDGTSCQKSLESLLNEDQVRVQRMIQLCQGFTSFQKSFFVFWRPFQSALKGTEGDKDNFLASTMTAFVSNCLLITSTMSPLDLFDMTFPHLVSTGKKYADLVLSVLLEKKYKGLAIEEGHTLSTVSYCSFDILVFDEKFTCVSCEKFIISEVFEFQSGLVCPLYQLRMLSIKALNSLVNQGTSGSTLCFLWGDDLKVPIIDNIPLIKGFLWQNTRFEGIIKYCLAAEEEKQNAFIKFVIEPNCQKDNIEWNNVEIVELPYEVSEESKAGEDSSSALLSANSVAPEVFPDSV